MSTNRFYDTLYPSEQGTNFGKPFSAPPHTTTHLLEYLLCFLRSVQILSEKGILIRERGRHHREESTNSKTLRQIRNPLSIRIRRGGAYLQHQQWLFLRDKTPYPPPCSPGISWPAGDWRGLPPSSQAEVVPSQREKREPREEAACRSV